MFALVACGARKRASKGTSFRGVRSVVYPSVAQYALLGKAQWKYAKLPCSTAY